MYKTRLGDRRQRRRQESVEVNQLFISLCIACMLAINDRGGFHSGTSWLGMTRWKKMEDTSTSKTRLVVVRKRLSATARS
jgi:hypothetical protein